MDPDVGLSETSVVGPFKPKMVDRDTDLMTKLQTFTSSGRPWKYSSNSSTSYRLIKLDRGSCEYKKVLGRIGLSTPEVLFPDLSEIKRMENVYLWEQFCLKRAYKREIYPSLKAVELFHATTGANLDSICKHNLNWRRVGSTGYLGNKYGTGVTFSPDFRYARQFPRGETSSERTMLLCDVLIGKSHSGTRSTHIPEEGYDTTISPNGRVVVKYDDNEFYPKYVITYFS